MHLFEHSKPYRKISDYRKKSTIRMKNELNYLCLCIHIVSEYGLIFSGHREIKKKKLGWVNCFYFLLMLLPIYLRILSGEELDAHKKTLTLNYASH